MYLNVTFASKILTGLASQVLTSLFASAFAQAFYPPRAALPTVPPCGPGTTVLAWPDQPAAADQPRYNGKRSDEIRPTPSRAPPWTGQVVAVSSRTFFRPFSDSTPTKPLCPNMLRVPSWYIVLWCIETATFVALGRALDSCLLRFLVRPILGRHVIDRCQRSQSLEGKVTFVNRHECSPGWRCSQENQGTPRAQPIESQSSSRPEKGIPQRGISTRATTQPGNRSLKLGGAVRPEPEVRVGGFSPGPAPGHFGYPA